MSGFNGRRNGGGACRIPLVSSRFLFWASWVAGSSYTPADRQTKWVSQIYTGVVDGTRVPTAQRWQMLYTMWVPYQAGGFGATSFLLVAMLLMASEISNENVKLLAYVAAIIAVAGCVSWSLTGMVIFNNYRTVLRQAEAD